MKDLIGKSIKEYESFDHLYEPTQTGWDTKEYWHMDYDLDGQNPKEIFIRTSMKDDIVKEVVVETYTANYSLQKTDVFS